jgi:hypothetical protein
MKARIFLLALVAAILFSGCATQIYVSGNMTTVDVRRPLEGMKDSLYVIHDWDDYPSTDIRIHCTMSTIGPVVLGGKGEEVKFLLPVGDEITFWFEYQNPVSLRFYHGQVTYRVPAPDLQEFHAWYIDRDFLRRHVSARGKWKYGF